MTKYYRVRTPSWSATSLRGGRRMTENEKFYVIKLNDKLYLDARIEPNTICARCTFTKDLDKAERYVNSADARSASEDLGGYVVEASYQLRRLEAEPHD